MLVIKVVSLTEVVEPGRMTRTTILIARPTNNLLMLTSNLNLDRQNESGM